MMNIVIIYQMWVLNFTVSKNNLNSWECVFKMQMSGHFPNSIGLLQAQEFAFSNESLQMTQMQVCEDHFQKLLSREFS